LMASRSLLGLVPSVRAGREKNSCSAHDADFFVVVRVFAAPIPPRLPPQPKRGLESRRAWTRLARRVALPLPPRAGSPLRPSRSLAARPVSRLIQPHGHFGILGQSIRSSFCACEPPRMWRDIKKDHRGEVDAADAICENRRVSRGPSAAWRSAR